MLPSPGPEQAPDHTDYTIHGRQLKHRSNCSLIAQRSRGAGGGGGPYGYGAPATRTGRLASGRNSSGRYVVFSFLCFLFFFLYYYYWHCYK